MRVAAIVTIGNLKVNIYKFILLDSFAYMKVKNDSVQLREKIGFVFDRVPIDRMDQYLQWR